MIVNDRNSFIKKIEEIDNFYIGDYIALKDIFSQQMKEKNCKNYKELNKDNPFYLSHVDIEEIKHITLSHKETENPFMVFYNLDDECIKNIFYLLAKTHKALRYYKRYSSENRSLKAKNMKGNLASKINDVIEIMLQSDKTIIEHMEKINAGIEEKNSYYSPTGYKAFEYLCGLLDSLKNKHYTKRQLFENLLFEMYQILINQNIAKQKIFNTVNLIIKIYFQENMNKDSEVGKEFTPKTKLDNFVTLNYVYETRAGIDITHSSKGQN